MKKQILTAALAFTLANAWAANEAVYYPAQSLVNIPAVVVDGDASGAVYSVDMQHDDALRFSVTRMDEVARIDLDSLLPGRRQTANFYNEGEAGNTIAAIVTFTFRTEQIDGVETIIRTQVVTDTSGNIVSQQDKYYEKRADGLYLTKLQYMDVSSGTPTVMDTRVKVPPKLILPTNSTPGQRWVNRTETIIYAGSDGDETARDFSVEARTLLGSTTISVAAGSFDNCIAVLTEGDNQKVDTFCHGAGLVESFTNSSRAELAALD